MRTGGVPAPILIEPQLPSGESTSTLSVTSRSFFRSFRSRVQRNVCDANRFAFLVRQPLDHRNRRAAVECREMQHGTMVEGEAAYAAGRRHRLGKKCGVFIVADRRSRALEMRQAQPLPAIRIVGNRERNARPIGSERRVRHHVCLQNRNVGDARILASVSAPLTPLVRRLRLERKSRPAHRDAGRRRIGEHRPDPRHVSACDAARIKQQLALRPARCSGIQYPARFRAFSVGTHYEAEALYARAVVGSLVSAVCAESFGTSISPTEDRW